MKKKYDYERKKNERDFNLKKDKEKNRHKEEMKNLDKEIEQIKKDFELGKIQLNNDIEEKRILSDERKEEEKNRHDEKMIELETNKINMEKQKEIEKIQIEKNHDKEMKSIEEQSKIEQIKIKSDHDEKMKQMDYNKDVTLNSQNLNFELEKKKLENQHEMNVINAITALKDVKSMDENLLKIMANVLSKNNKNNK